MEDLIREGESYAQAGERAAREAKCSPECATAYSFGYMFALLGYEREPSASSEGYAWAEYAGYDEAERRRKALAESFL